MGALHNNLDRALASVRSQQQRLHHKITTASQLVQQSQALEQSLAGDLSTELTNQLEWARGVH